MRVFALAVLAAIPAVCQTRNPFEGNREASEVGRGIFRIYCGPCHGIRAEGGRGPDLTLGNYNAGNSDEALYKVIAGGIDGTEMPSYADRMDSDNLWRLIAYIRSVAKKDPPSIGGDAANGARLFSGKAGCAQCHRVGEKGSRMGPDLTIIGRTRSAGYLKESMTAPNATMTPGYNTVQVVTRDGRTITGVQRAYDAFSAQFVDAKDNYYSFLRDEVKSMKREVKSMMPAYDKMLSAREIDDLVAYMAHLRGAR